MFISIIVPFYNVEKYIEQCIKSLCNQDIPNDQYEIICVNDCSPDNSVEIVKKLQKEYPQIRLVEHSKNKKLGGARNTGLHLAKGDYIWYIDSDDYVQTNVLGRVRDILLAEEIDFLHFNYNELQDGNIVKIQHNEDIDVVSGIDLFLHSSMNWSRDHIVAWTKIYNRKFLIDNSLFFAEDVMYEDNDYAFLCYFFAKRVKHISYPLYIYRCNPSSITRISYTDSHIAYWLKLCKRLISVQQIIEKQESDIKYNREIKTFIRNIIYQIISTYGMLDKVARYKAKQYIKSQITSEYKPYMSRINYWKFKLGFI